MLEKLKQFICDGEGLAVEFKRCTNELSNNVYETQINTLPIHSHIGCTNELSNSVYETVSSFSNRYGGYMLLGV
ncbi:hypothetical protein LQZ18_16645 [Lachnospiraceae bacterium ZAX-1]